MTHEVFKCDNYEVKGGILVIYNATLVGKVKNIDGFVKLTSLVNYDAIICPDLFTDISGSVFDGFLLTDTK